MKSQGTKYLGDKPDCQNINYHSDAQERDCNLVFTDQCKMLYAIMLVLNNCAMT